MFVTMFGGGRIDLKVVAEVKILPLLEMMELGLKKHILLSSYSGLFCRFWV